MKKIAMILVLLMVVAAAPGFAVSATVNTFIDGRMNSSLSPVQDAGEILHHTKKGVDHTYTTVTKPLGFILNPIYKVRDVSFDAVNKIYDTVTFRHLRK